MRIVQQSHALLEVTVDPLGQIEEVARTCYRSHDRVEPGSAERMVKALIKRGHEAMLEFGSATFRFVTDRGVSHEIVRHRLCSFAQESTRFCDYNGEDIAFVQPVGEYTPEGERAFMEVCANSERQYKQLRQLGWPPEIARGALVNFLKTEINVRANFRAWRHIFKLRVLGVTGRPHPQIRALMAPALIDLAKAVPVIFDDLVQSLAHEEG